VRTASGLDLQGLVVELMPVAHQVEIIVQVPDQILVLMVEVQVLVHHRMIVVEVEGSSNVDHVFLLLHIRLALLELPDGISSHGMAMSYRLGRRQLRILLREVILKLGIEAPRLLTVMVQKDPARTRIFRLMKMEVHHEMTDVSVSVVVRHEKEGGTGVVSIEVIGMCHLIGKETDLLTTIDIVVVLITTVMIGIEG